MITVDKLIAVVMAAIFAFLFAATTTWPSGLANNTVLTPYFLPRLYCGAIVGLCIILFLTSKKSPKVQVGKDSLLRFLLFSGVFAVYLIALRYIGFLVSTALLVAAITIITGTKPLRALIYAVLASGVCYLFFEKLFHVLLP